MVSGRLYLTSDLTTKDEISLYSTSRFISATATEALSSAIFQRNSSDAVWSWSKVVEIVDFNPPTLECILSTQRWVSSATNSTRPQIPHDRSLHWTCMPHTIQAGPTQIQPQWTPIEASSTPLAVSSKNQPWPCSSLQPSQVSRPLQNPFINQ